MSTVRKKLGPPIVIVLLCCAVCSSQDIASDFDQALAMLPEEPKWPSGIMYYDMQDAANSFVSKHADISAVEFLETKMEDPISTKLVLLSLAKLASANETAENTLYRQIYRNKSIIRRHATTVIAHLDPNDGRRIAETLLTQAGPWEVRRPAVDMLVGLGDKCTLEMLKQMKPDEKYLIVKKALEAAIAELEYRLTQVPPDKQAEWAQQESLCWRTLRETPLPRKVAGENRVAATTLYMQGFRFSQAARDCNNWLSERNLGSAKA